MKLAFFRTGLSFLFRPRTKTRRPDYRPDSSGNLAFDDARLDVHRRWSALSGPRLDLALWPAHNGTVTSAVIGRDDELVAIGAFLDAVCVGPRALVFAGEAGIGKTLLWEAGVAQAKGRVGRVLSCRGAEAEASLSFAALSELVGPVFDEVAPSLAGPRRRALAVALLLEEPGEARPDAHAIGLAVRDALRVLAAGGPVVVALDDAQWLDPASAGVLGVALRRLEDDHVGVLATVRTGSPVAAPLEQG